jgi:hypothetical protein
MLSEGVNRVDEGRECASTPYPEEARSKAEDKASASSVAIQRYAGEHTFENTTASITLTGRGTSKAGSLAEGRNVRAFQAATATADR